MNLRPLDLKINPSVQTILTEVSKMTSFACIAGGYLRDLYYRVPFKDIDIFVGDDFGVDKLENSFLNEWVLKQTDKDEEHPYKGVPGAFTILNLTHATKPPIQIMIGEFDGIESVLKGFDFGFCQIAYNGNGVFVTDEFWQDAVNDTATYLLKRKTTHSEDHRKRLAEKYPNLTWVWNKDGESCEFEEAEEN